jgi:thiol peroxidase
MEERTNEAFEFAEKLTVVGGKLQPGDTAPDFTLDRFDPDAGAMQTVRLADSAGKIRLLNVVNSLDTPVCHVETRRWEGLRADLPSDVIVYTISMDLPFAQARWHSAENVTHQSLSAHKSEQFGQDYGVLLKEWRLLQRAVFVIDRDDRIAHAEYVADQMQEPNYDAAVAAARSAAG